MKGSFYLSFLSPRLLCIQSGSVANRVTARMRFCNSIGEKKKKEKKEKETCVIKSYLIFAASSLRIFIPLHQEWTIRYSNKHVNFHRMIPIKFFNLLVACNPVFEKTKLDSCDFFLFPMFLIEKCSSNKISPNTNILWKFLAHSSRLQLLLQSYIVTLQRCFCIFLVAHYDIQSNVATRTQSKLAPLNFSNNIARDP